LSNRYVLGNVERENYRQIVRRCIVVWAQKQGFTHATRTALDTLAQMIEIRLLDTALRYACVCVRLL
jgi:hypothetical protein